MKCLVWLHLKLTFNCSYFSSSSGRKAKVVPNPSPFKIYRSEEFFKQQIANSEWGKNLQMSTPNQLWIQNYGYIDLGWWEQGITSQGTLEKSQSKNTWGLQCKISLFFLFDFYGSIPALLNLSSSHLLQVLPNYQPRFLPQITLWWDLELGHLAKGPDFQEIPGTPSLDTRTF